MIASCDHDGTLIHFARAFECDLDLKVATEQYYYSQ